MMRFLFFIGITWLSLETGVSADTSSPDYASSRIRNLCTTQLNSPDRSPGSLDCITDQEMEVGDYPIAAPFFTF